MKPRRAFCSLALLASIFTACGVFDSLTGKEDPNELGGDPNVDQGQVGYKALSGSVLVGDQYYDIGSSIEVVKNEDGVATIKVVADLTKVPALAPFDDLIPADMKDVSGKINTEVKLKLTDEGIQDYFNKDQKPHTLVKYDCNVGDEYKITKSDGKTITRTVTAKSTTDDFPYGFMYIKTIAIEQDSRVPGIKKFIYRANHRFGLVYFQVVADDGTTASVYF
jgi:hypothetical protein